ncbi:MAG: ankyrin repeat domain-containing protein [Gammaproteobacteria bacterium]|jgi:ankyrin repeat protein
MCPRRSAACILAAATLLLWAGVSAAQSPLADAIQNGRRSIALEFLAEDADVNAAQGDGTTALHWAVYQVDLPLVEALLARGADPRAVNSFGATALAEAVKVAHVGIVERLLDAGADPEAANLDGQTALMLAARSGSLEIARLLVEHGADVNAQEAWREQTALMWAADGRHGALTRYLVEQGADVHARAATNDWGSQITSEPRAQYRPTGGLTPLIYAARSGCLECISAILDGGEDIDRPTPDGVTALMIAIDNYEFDAAGLLLDEGANPHYSDWWGRTALYLAVDMNTYVSRTIKGGLVGNGDGVDTFPGATASVHTSAIDIIKRLLAAGVEVNPQLNMHRVGRGGNSQRFTDNILTVGATPLLRAAIKHDHETMRLLLEHGAEVDLPNVMGVTPLMAAASIGVRDINFGANRSPAFASDPLIQDKVITSLEILLAAGADINAAVSDTHSRTARIARPSQLSNALGHTGIFRAAMRGWDRVVRFMIDNGARVDVIDENGYSPLDVALGRTPVSRTVHQDVADIIAAAAG